MKYSSICTVLVFWAQIAGAQNFETKLLASDGASSDVFGRSVSIDGSRAIVGAYGNDDNGSNSGSAYVFEWDGSAWVEKARLLASDGATSDLFGRSVSIDGSRAIVGAYGNDDNGSNSGSAYVFEWDGSAWVEKAKLLPSDGASNDQFGRSVSIDGSRVIVGAHRNDDNGADSGSAYVFEWDGSAWVEKDRLLASDGASGDVFGRSVSIDGSRVIVGAHRNDDNGTDSGSAYVFEWDGSAWIEQAKLLASDGASGDFFGRSVSIDGSQVIVGAYGNDDNGTDSGSAYVFEWAGSAWVEKARLLASDGASEDFFGHLVSIDSSRVIVGAHGNDDNGSNSGSAYVFEWDGSAWVEKAKLLAGDGASDDFFGISVSIDGSRAIVGAHGNDDNGDNSGSAYVFDLRTGVGTGTENMERGVPEEFVLRPTYPNPFNPWTQITIDLPEAVHVRLVIYDVQGREVEVMVDQATAAGTYTYRWDATTRPSGVYLVHVQAGSYSSTERVVLAK